ncbi:hypothetical protein EX30DRAFT_123373 [Ascodesmis nigricans]|uniref:Uncharacterized protein n=1 Tax=Ascodesmis nigricans TaxID=341454 RepID=A0A4S2MPT9_9PEZI|nr:hypothetical protein EX30DRAFT_123373 [Ascodesmis nigricans]
MQCNVEYAGYAAFTHTPSLSSLILLPRVPALVHLDAVQPQWSPVTNRDVCPLAIVVLVPDTRAVLDARVPPWQLELRLPFLNATGTLLLVRRCAESEAAHAGFTVALVACSVGLAGWLRAR